MYLLDTNICIYIIKKKPVDVLKTLKTKSKKLILVTNNTKEFERVEGLKIENWLQA